MKIKNIRNIKIKDSRLILIAIIFAILAILALINNYKILADIFKGDEVENRIISNYIEETGKENHITENVLTK